MSKNEHSVSKPLPAENKVAGGYLRVSIIAFPDNCRTVPERMAFVEVLRSIRKAELVKEAAQNGEVITRWYDDLGISGRGEFYPKRLAFSRARLDAKERELHSFYARDLSRLFRNVVQQELWFAEMEDLKVTVHAQDLPFASDAATRRLLRQQMGITHEYVSSRQGALVRERICTRLLSGVGVPYAQTLWGLRYNPERKAYDYDPETADKIRLVFETYVACDGSGTTAARQLNLMLAQGHPQATASPSGKIWYAALLLRQVGNLRYRRIISYGDLRIPALERIPAVVDPELVARADPLLLERTIHAVGTARDQKGCKPFTYSGVLQCGYCGSPIRSLPNMLRLKPALTRAVPDRSAQTTPRSTREPINCLGERTKSVTNEAGINEAGINEIAGSQSGAVGGVTLVSYQCKSPCFRQGCTVHYSMQQQRLHRLIDRGLRQAFQDIASPDIASSGTASPDTDSPDIASPLGKLCYRPDDGS